MTLSAVTIAQELIRCPSVTPKDANAQVYLARILKEMGFECHHFVFGDVPNLFARLGTEGPHFCYGGHTDVVPPGPEKEWRFGPFNPEIKDGVLYGRGASDMKGSVAAFTAAISAYLAKHGKPKGSISLLITGDEEGPAIDGTIKVLEWMQANKQLPDVAIVGEPTNPDTLGEEIKIGRRGSFTGRITVRGTQGHAAYPHRADNPIPRLIKMLDALAGHKFDKGTEFFQPTNLEVTSVDVGNPASNVIPGEAHALFNIRFNEIWSSATLEAKIREILDTVHKTYTLETSCGAESFFTPPGPWSETVKQAVKEVTGLTPAYTTNGGTSDARFFRAFCPVVEFGGVNKTVHQIDESANVKDLEQLAEVFTRVLEIYFK
jgi:succinyl-diaminopimelate desuccinylase